MTQYAALLISVTLSVHQRRYLSSGTGNPWVTQGMATFFSASTWIVPTLLNMVGAITLSGSVVSKVEVINPHNR